jgi:hypothetical protein
LASSTDSAAGPFGVDGVFLMRIPDKFHTRDKQLLRLEREAWRLRRARHDAPVVPLERPYQRGWIKTYVLADGIDRRRDAPIFRTILAAVNRRVYSRERTFLRRRTGEPIVLQPRVLHVREMEQYGWPPTHRALFELGTWMISDAPSWIRWGRGRSLGYRLIQIEWLREDVQPHLVTHRQVLLPDVESRLAEIESFLTRTCGRYRLDRLSGRSQWWRRMTESRAEGQAREAFAHVQVELTPD